MSPYLPMLETSAVHVNVATPLPSGSGYRLLVVAIGVILVEGLVIAHRVWGRLPADLDRVGSELNLVAYGTAVSFFSGVFLGVVVLPGFPSKDSGAFFMIILIFFLFNLYAYGYNVRLSDRLRAQPSLKDGIQNLNHLRYVLSDPRELILLVVSWAVGLISTIACFAAQVFWG